MKTSYLRPAMLLSSAVLLLTATVNCRSSLTATGRILTQNDADVPVVFPDDVEMIFPRTETAPPSGRISATSLDAAEAVGKVLEDRYFRSPVAVLVDTDRESLQYVRALWDRLQGRLNDTEHRQFLFLSFNESVMMPPVKVTGTEGLKALIDGQAPSVRSAAKGSVAFFSVLKAIDSVPYDGALLLFTGRTAADEDLAQLAAQSLINRRCKLFVVWSVPAHDMDPGVEALYGEVATRTGGNLYTVNDVEDHTAPGTEQDSGDLTQVVIATWSGVSGQQRVPVHIDSTVRFFNVTVIGSVEEAFIRKPSGSDVNLLSGEPTPRLVVTRDEQLINARFDTFGVAPGQWSLVTRGSSAQYDVIVTAQSRLSFTAAVTNQSASSSERMHGPTLLRLKLQGDIGRVDGVRLVDQTGVEFGAFDYRNKAHKAGQLDISASSLPHNPFYVQLQGTDRRGAEFTRVTPVTPRGGPVVPVTVELSSGSSLYVRPGQVVQLQYEVTNYLPVPAHYHLSATDKQGLIRAMDRTQAVIAPQSSVSVTVTVEIPRDALSGLVDTLTVTAAALFGPNRASRAVYLTVGDQVADTDKPRLSYSFKSDCDLALENNNNNNNCYTAFWRVEATVQDKKSGIVRVTSEPRGLDVGPTFIAGTKEPFPVSYSASCCDPLVTLVATDARGNYVKETIDVRDANNLTGAEIAGIVVGVILIIGLIIAIIAIVMCCRKKRSETLRHTAN